MITELDDRAGEFDRAPDFEELARRRAEPLNIVDLDEARPRTRRRRAMMLAAAVALVAGVGITIGLTPESGMEVAARSATTDEGQYYWPTQLPAGWEIIETKVVPNDNPTRGAGVLGAVAADDRLVLVSVDVSAGGDEGGREPVEIREIDGVKIGVDYVDENDAFLEWQVDGYEFSLLARGVGLDEAFRLAGEVR